MRIYHHLCLFTALCTSMASYAADSTNSTVVKSQIKASTAEAFVTLSVTHIASNVSYNGYAVTCPTATFRSYSTGQVWQGNSPVKNATLVDRDNFFPAGPGPRSNGYVVWSCSETYSVNDPYYASLTANTTVGCQGGVLNNEICTVKPKSSLSGVLPVHFVVNTPSQAMVRNSNMNTYNRIGYVTPQIVGGTPQGPWVTAAGMPNVTGGNQTDFSYPYSVGSTYNILAKWPGEYVQTDGGGNGYSFPYNANGLGGLQSGASQTDVMLSCPDYSGTFPSLSSRYLGVTITTGMLGKTCTLSCLEAQWHVYGPSSDNPWYTSGQLMYFGAPLQINCK